MYLPFWAEFIEYSVFLPISPLPPRSRNARSFSLGSSHNNLF